MNYRTIIEKLSKPAILATAFLVFWIYLGSIINFHQHHIFGRTLMSQGILCKREDALSPGHDLPVYLLVFTAADISTEQYISDPLWMEVEAGSGIVNVLTPKSGIPLFHGLRAPPVA
ncbi:MAG: hypothetical protein IPN08_13780 [Bacteroidales bacterium]|nr:hypothetical protein [Bacteroidales bacterium]